MKSCLWKKCYSQWKTDGAPKLSGYTILLMVPGDLPVFFNIAMEVCMSQHQEHLREVLVIPDQTTKIFKKNFENAKRDNLRVPLRLVELNPVEQRLTKYFKNPHMNNWLQFIRGCEAARTAHILWHDADLFIKKSDFLKKHYEACVGSNFSCYGVSPVWDKWYGENGLPHLTSTWELMMDAGWVKSFKPWQHRGHDGAIKGKRHTFDITLLPQCLTPADRIGYLNADEEFIHFNYVIGTYRQFQNSKGTFSDKNFKLLLVRLLADMYDPEGVYEVPTMETLVDGLKEKKGRVIYDGSELAEAYGYFRKKFQKLMDSGLLNEERQKTACSRLTLFDNHFNSKI